MADRIAVIGEPLIELSPHESVPDAYRRGLGGDTLNTAIYLARLLGAGADLRYLSRLGDDAMSGWMRARIAAEGIDTSRIAAVPGRSPGLYMIATDAAGERSFTYWRSTAPARDMFSRDGEPAEALDDAAVVYLSGITLAVISPDARARLLARLGEAAARGSTVAYDTNHRPVLWESAAAARTWTEAAFGAATLVLPSIEDMVRLGIAAEDDPDAALDALSKLTEAEVVLKAGERPVHHMHRGARRAFPVAAAPSILDTTGAGDSFNAGFLAARLAGLDAAGAIAFAQRLAREVVGRRGAVIAADAMPRLGASQA